MNSCEIKRGGARPGAGRKPKGRIPSVMVSFRLSPERRDDLRAFLKERSMTVSAFVEEALGLMKEK